jgi:plasmid stabilization system protein ParE
MKEIHWSTQAEITFDAVYQFVLQQWGFETAEGFRQQTLKTLNQVSKHPLSFQESSIKNVRKAIVSKHTSFFYEVLENKILLVYFWDNCQQPLF